MRACQDNINEDCSRYMIRGCFVTTYVNQNIKYKYLVHSRFKY